MTVVPSSSSREEPLRLGAALRQWRVLRRIKQEHAAELLGVAQSTISRWENGRQALEPPERRKVEALFAARPDGAADRALLRLVEGSRGPVHLICDHTHRLLALSPVRARAFVGACALVGSSLRPFATRELLEAEASLPALGWYDSPNPPELEVDTGANGSRLVPIRPGRCRWTRLRLSDGSAARLVETLA